MISRAVTLSVTALDPERGPGGWHRDQISGGMYGPRLRSLWVVYRDVLIDFHPVSGLAFAAPAAIPRRLRLIATVTRATPALRTILMIFTFVSRPGLAYI